jgi:hypothetical protein
MGAGNIFRGVAQGLLGAGSGAMDYALERDKELRKQQWMMEQIAAQKERRQLLPIEEQNIQSQIDERNWKMKKGRVGDGDGDDGTAIDKRVLSIIKAEEEARGQVYSPREFGKRKAQLLGVSLFKPASQDYTEEATNPLSPIPNAMPSFLPRQGQAPAPAPVAPPTAPTSLPPRRAGETQEQYSARTGIQFK